MTYRSQFWFLASIFLWVELLSASDPAGQPTHGVLVLRNGEVLAGTTSKVGDRYVVAKSDGTELRIPAHEVEMHCLDLDEAYLRKRQRISPRDASGMVQLADWCLRYELYARAADELLRAMAIAPRDPRIQALERRLQAVTAPERNLAMPAIAESSSPRPAPSDPIASPLPAEAVESFVSRVQPLLINRCASNGCHGGRSPSEFQLLTLGPGKALPFRHTQRNLAAVMQRVDSANPESSPLLVIPQRPHGGLAAGVFSERDRAQLELLENWVARAGRTTAPQAVSAHRDPNQPSPHGLEQVSVKTGDPSSKSESRLRLTQRCDAAENEDCSTLDYRDPFDPERFNRRYLPPSAVQEAKPSADASEPQP